MEKQSTRIIKLSGEMRLRETHGAIHADSLRNGPGWLVRIYDQFAKGLSNKQKLYYGVA